MTFFLVVAALVVVFGALLSCKQWPVLASIGVAVVSFISMCVVIDSTTTLSRDWGQEMGPAISVMAVAFLLAAGATIGSLIRSFLSVPGMYDHNSRI